MANERFPRVGVGVIVQNNQKKIVLGKRKNAHGEREWALPGGHLEFGETPIECAVRELYEETGMCLVNPTELTFTNDIFHASNKHYITIFIQGYSLEEPKLLEPHKCEGWKWFDLNNLPMPLFLPFDTFLKKGKVLSDGTAI